MPIGSGPSSPSPRTPLLPRRWRSWAKDRVRGLDFVLLVTVAAVLAAAWIFLAVAAQVARCDTQQIDEAVLLALRTPGDPADPLGPVWLEEAARDVTALGSTPVLVLVTLVVGGYFALRRMRGALVLLLVATTGGGLLLHLLKWVFARARPEVVPHLVRVATTSFPSAHSTLSAIVFLTLGALLARTADRRRIRAYAVTVALCAAFLVGVTRIYLGVHYPSDVLAGWSLGVVWSLVCWLVARMLQRRGAVERAPPAPISPEAGTPSRGAGG